MSGSLREIPSGEHLEYKAKVRFLSPESKCLHTKVDITVTFPPNHLRFSETSGCSVSLVIATLWTEGTVVVGGAAEASPYTVFAHYFHTFERPSPLKTRLRITIYHLLDFQSQTRLFSANNRDWRVIDWSTERRAKCC